MSRGDFERKISTAERDASAARLREQGKTYTAIANELGYVDRGHARQAVQRALAATVREAGDELRVLELQRLDRLLDTAWQVMERMHYAHSAGRLIRNGDTPIVDDSQTLSVLDRILKIMERRAKLFGLDAPVRHEVLTMDTIDAELARLEREHADLARAAARAGGHRSGLHGRGRCRPRTACQEFLEPVGLARVRRGGGGGQGVGRRARRRTSGAAHPSWTRRAPSSCARSSPCTSGGSSSSRPRLMHRNAWVCPSVPARSGFGSRYSRARISSRVSSLAPA